MALPTAMLTLGLVTNTTRIIARDFYFAFGLFTILGGIMGFVKAKSRISLISGSISGVILIVASFLFAAHPIVVGVAALCVSVLLAGKFVPDFIHKRAIVPGGVMAILSVASIILTILAMTR